MQLDSRLESDSIFVVDLNLCQLRLHNNATFPWVILIPKRDNASEIIDLNKEDQQLLMMEIAQVSRVMKQLFKPDKLNVASLGNIVSQLHIHIIARYEADPAWPGTVWGINTNSKYESKVLEKIILDLRAAFN